MLRLFAASCFVVDVSSAIASLGIDARSGFTWWLTCNAALLGLPLAYRLIEPLLSAIAADPNTIDRDLLDDTGFGLDPLEPRLANSPDDETSYELRHA